MIKACYDDAKRKSSSTPTRRNNPMGESTYHEDLEKVTRHITPMNSRSRSSNNNKRKYSDSDSENDSSDREESEETSEATNLRPVGRLARDNGKRQRLSMLKQRVYAANGGHWKCKFCSKGDGKIAGLCGYNMKLIYNLEDDMRGLKQDQFIRTIVDKYNELVVDQNALYNPEEHIPKLTYDEYELHLYECYSRRNVKEWMWSRIEFYEEEIDYINTNGTKYVTEEGRRLLNHKDAKVLVSYESQMRTYLVCVDRIDTREKKEKEKEKQKLKQQMARAGKSFYDK